MASGVKVQGDCVDIFNQIKMGHKFRYVVYALTPDHTEISVLKTAPQESTYDDFVQDLKDAAEARECRYGVYDADYTLQNGQKRSKLVFFLWSPEGATIKQKMLYTSSKDALRKKLVGIGKERQCCDEDDLNWTNVEEVLIRSEAA